MHLDAANNDSDYLAYGCKGTFVTLLAVTASFAFVCLVVSLELHTLAPCAPRQLLRCDSISHSHPFVEPVECCVC